MNADIVIIGGGAAGLAAAYQAYDSSINIVLIEREKQLGGILNQCIHNGFGLHQFKEELTGPEYAFRYASMCESLPINVLLGTTVIKISKPDLFVIQVSNEKQGLFDIHAKAVIMTNGCYERTRGQIRLPGYRPKGIYTAGTAQRYLNIDGYLVGKRVFILGSGDIGLIMARRMTLEGAHVLGVAELMPYSNGLTRNIVQCLDDFDIPLYLSHTITDIRGKDKIEGITVAKVNASYEPIAETAFDLEIDALLLSVGLIPDTKLLEDLPIEISPITKGATVDQTYQTSLDGLFVCGNALHVHDLVDWVSEEAAKAGTYAKQYIKQIDALIRTKNDMIIDHHLRYIVPQYIDTNQRNTPIRLSYRTTEKIKKMKVMIYQNSEILNQKIESYVVPSEMKHIDLDPKLIDKAQAIYVKVEVIELW